MKYLVRLLLTLSLLALTGCQALGGSPAAATPTRIVLPRAEAPGAQGTALQTPGATSAAANSVARPAAQATGAPTPVLKAESRMESTPAIAAQRPITSTTGPGVGTPAPSGGSDGPTRILAIGKRLSITLYEAPGGAIAATIPGSTVLRLEERSTDGQWLRATYGEDNAVGWAAATDVVPWGDVSILPVAGAQNPTPAPSTGIAAVARPGRVLADRLNVRAGPGAGERVLGVLQRDAVVSVRGRNAAGDWLSVSGQDIEGWAAAQFIEVSGGAATLPLVGAQAAAAVGVAAPPPSSRAASGSGGKIAFETASGGDIYVLNADGSGLRKVTTGLDPALSPDGNQLAFARWGSGGEGDGIFVFDIKTGKERQVITAKRPRGPTWSPDGTRLAFANLLREYDCYNTPFGCIDVALVQQALGRNGCAETPFGRVCLDDEGCVDSGSGKICLRDFPITRVQDHNLVQAQISDGKWQDLKALTPVQAPAWRPGSDEILYRVPKGLEITSPGGDTRPLVKDSPRINGAAWSPDGQRFVVQSREKDHDEIFLYNKDGQFLSALTRPAPLTRRAVHNVAPTWSPDGRYIVFLSDRDGPWRFYRMNPDGSSPAPLLPAVLGKIEIKYDWAAERMISWSR